MWFKKKKKTVKVAPSQTRSSGSISKGSFHFQHALHINWNHIRDCVASRRHCDSISLIESVLRLSSSGCRGDSWLEAGRGAASSPAYMEPLEVNFLIKSPQPSTLPPPAFVLHGCMWFNLCLCNIHAGCVFITMYNANIEDFKHQASVCGCILSRHRFWESI